MECLRYAAGFIIDIENMEKGCWLTCLFTLGCVHSLLFSAFHMEYFLTIRNIGTAQVTLAQSIYWIWNTANDVFSGWLADSLALKQGSRLPLLLLVHLFWPFASILPFLPVPTYLLSTGETITPPKNHTTPWLKRLIFKLDFPAGSFYLLCISLYDGCVSLAMIARNTFLTEITNNERFFLQMISHLQPQPQPQPQH